MNKLENRTIFRVVKTRLMPLMRMQAFWVVTFLGNGFVLFGATALYFLEKEYHPKSFTMLDSLSWAVGLVTTIGYGDLIPVTNLGKILGIIMMIGGTLFLWSYMALLVGVLLSPDISLIEREIKGIKRDTSIDDKKMDEIILKIEQIHASMERFKDNGLGRRQSMRTKQENEE